jgi:hypothetical protein
MEKKVDRIIIGAGIYGLYAARVSAKKGERVVILEYDNNALSRGSYINQARVHNGYHYPRSYSTAIKSSIYFDKFNKEFQFAINDRFEKIYATSKKNSWTSAEQFRKFCNNAKIRCEEVNPDKYFKKGLISGAFITEEYSFDAIKIKDYYISELENYSKVNIIYNSRIDRINIKGDNYEIVLNNGDRYVADFVLNATYASINQMITKLGLETFKIKYEICEIIICNTTGEIENVGITVMDGPFFSVMPFGLSGSHSLTSVTFTPHKTSYNELPSFNCQKDTECSDLQLKNCNNCNHRPSTAWNYMYTLSKKYLKPEIKMTYTNSLFSIKPILLASEIDDSRPTLIKYHSVKPTFISVLSGKFNTIYDLDEVL